MEWNISPEIVAIGPLSLRWYGLLFASSFIIGLQIMLWMFKKEDKNIDDLNDLVWFMVLGTVIGARLGHCLFYNPEYYLSHPLEILKVWKGGLASHGAVIGIITGLYFYMKKGRKYSYLWLIDRVSITVALAAFFIRTGNLFNSEIIGTETTVPWAFKFVLIDNVPRHPAQLYEALAYLAVFILLILWYKKKEGQIPEGRILGVFLVLVFGFRFFVEFIKEDQTYFEAGMLLNMGQLLSIPVILGGVYLIFRSGKEKINAQI
ncbi:MAG: prolipoprotein diacylglyceryl transferase [Bacteroidetes bacterium]|nr:prolipoprotein diacylglyceryl transferase [Bacteroidota bacterium]